MKTGELIPNITLYNESNEPVNLSGYEKNAFLVVYFYPKDFTAGCTKQACSFRDNYSFFEENDCPIIGISSDRPEKHESFKSHYSLPFTLLSDNNGEAKRAFDVPGFLLGLIPGRVTYVFKRGRLIKTINSMLSFEKHIDEAKQIISEEKEN